MSREAQSVLFLCDGAERPLFSELKGWQTVEELNHRGDDARVNLRIENLSHALLATLEPRHWDLVRIDAYAYVADQSLSRGGDADVHGRDWRRHLGLRIPVRDVGYVHLESVEAAEPGRAGAHA